MSWLQSNNVQLLREMAARCAHIPACSHGVNYKSWACCARFPSVAQLGGTCQRAPGAHQVIGQYVSSLAAEYLPSLAAALANCVAPYVSNLGHRNIPISQFAPEAFVHRRPAICDGAGLNSTADHSNARASPVTPLARKLLSYIHEKQLGEGIVAHLTQAQPTHPIADHHQFQLVQIARDHLHPQCSNKHCTRVAEGQPFRLQVLGELASATQDPDAALRQTLAQGVPTGIFDSVASSVQWPQRQSDLPCDAPDDVTLLRCSGNWTRAESNPETLEALLRNEIEQGWVKEFTGSLEEAKQPWPQRTAIGKLNLVFAEGKEPRLVLDSSVCNANQLRSIPEHVALPSSLDVRRSFLSSDQYGAWSALALDVKAARKRIKVRPSDQGALLFAWRGKLYHYTVCHFGAKFSAYWWRRIGAQIVRILRSAAPRMALCG